MKTGKYREGDEETGNITFTYPNFAEAVKSWFGDSQ